MKAAQRFPADFDGIIAGAPGLDWTGRAAQALRLAHALERDPSARLGPANRQRLHRAVLDACDARDGVKDGVVDDPASCDVDPAALQCAAAGGDGCLSAAQVATARMMYSSPSNPRSGRAITGLAPGSELGWTDLGWTASARATGLDQFRFLVFKDPAWVVGRFDFDADIVRAEETDDGTINALDLNLKPFIDGGGKLIQYHGWSDPQISPGNSTQYFSRAADALGGRERVDGSYPRFMAPGMAHCGGGDGPNTFDMLAALEEWVEHGRAPDRIIASHSTNGGRDRTRPLCPYPQHAVYKGTGSTDDQANFECRAR
jgi:feruloyl esterase